MGVLSARTRVGDGVRFQAETSPRSVARRDPSGSRLPALGPGFTRCTCPTGSIACIGRRSCSRLDPQHTAELAAMRAIVRVVRPQGMHLCCTRAMPPREALMGGADRPGGSQLARALRVAGALATSRPAGRALRTTPLIEVLARLGASAEDYPNTTTTLQCESGRQSVTLTGKLVDKDAAVVEGLRTCFAPPQFVV